MSAAYNIAIDGPAGAGKSTIARALAARLGFVYVDTGALYRAMGLYFDRKGIRVDDEESISRACGDIRISLRYEDGVQKVILDGEDVSGLIRTERVSYLASACSVYGAVRQKLLSLQRELAASTDVVMDGRDIGTCVLPDAQTKIYLTASVEVRARRRFRELEAKGAAVSLEEIEREIEERDRRDMNREIAPLRQAEDAVYLDTSCMSVEEVLEAILSAAEERGLKRPGEKGSAAGEQGLKK